MSSSIASVPHYENLPILLPPEHSTESNSDPVTFIRHVYPKLSKVKLKGGIFTGPQIHAMLKSKDLQI